jgi:hypothetical protein
MESGEISGGIKHIKRGAAKAKLASILSKDGPWCSPTGYRASDMDGQSFENVMLNHNQGNKPQCVERPGMKYGNAHKLCFISESKQWFLALVSSSPGGPIMGELAQRVENDFEKASKRAQKLFKPKATAKASLTGLQGSKKAVIQQLCTSSSAKRKVLDEQRGFILTELDYSMESGKITGGIRHFKKRKARAKLESLLGKNGPWCNSGEEYAHAVEDVFLGPENQEAVHCAEHPGTHHGDAHKLCFIHTSQGWFLHLAARGPGGPIMGELGNRVANDFEKASKRAKKLFR